MCVWQKANSARQRLSHIHMRLDPERFRAGVQCHSMGLVMCTAPLGSECSRGPPRMRRVAFDVLVASVGSQCIGSFCMHRVSAFLAARSSYLRSGFDRPRHRTLHPLGWATCAASTAAAVGRATCRTDGEGPAAIGFAVPLRLAASLQGRARLAVPGGRSTLPCVGAVAQFSSTAYRLSQSACRSPTARTVASACSLQLAQREH